MRLKAAEVKALVRKHFKPNMFPGLDDERALDLLVAQIRAESGFVTDAESPVGAQGLCQFMPGTWKSWGTGSPLEPEEAVKAQLKFMSFLYGRFPEISSPEEKFKMALGSYNAGRGHINAMLCHARQECGLPGPYNAWKNSGAHPGAWQDWNFACRHLKQVTGNHSLETINYVNRILGLASVI